MTDPLVPSGWRIHAIATLLRRFPPLRYFLLRRGYLRESGWVASAWANAPVDRSGRPVAWYTYSALDFLESRVSPEMEVFEYGAGHSTLWWAARVRSVCSVESDRGWVSRLRARLPENVDLRYEALDTNGDYANSAVARGREFDVIVIDGFDRNSCAKRCLAALKEHGVIVWDNADWVHLFKDGLDYVQAQGFSYLDFTGLGPLNGYSWATRVFYRRGANCLGI